MQYEDRIVVFIDILGFSELIGGTSGKNKEVNNVNFNKIVDCYNTIKELLDTSFYQDVKRAGSKKISIFSDSIVISFKLTDQHELLGTLYDVKLLVMELIKRDVLCRGAVSYGKFVHNDEYLFGPALVEAYNLENKAALYPRIIIDWSSFKAELGDELSKIANKEDRYISNILSVDSDGMYYIDYFDNVQAEFNNPIVGTVEYLEHLGDLIRSGIMGSVQPSKVSVKIKYLWMRERYNKTLKFLKNENHLKHIEKVAGPDVAKKYIDLKLISPARGASDHTPQMSE